MKRNGPEPITDVPRVNGPPAASFSRMMTARPLPLLASACSTGKGRLRRMVKVRLSTASRPATSMAMVRPTMSRLIHRFRDAITSRVVTGLPSWNSSPGRRVSV